MSRSLPSSIAAGAALVLATALAAVLPAGPASADPAFQQPDAGSCHSYPLAALDAPTEDSPAVPCTSPHTGYTVAVLAIDPGLSGRKAAARYLPECYSALRQALGGNAKRIARTAYELTLFRPNDAQLAQGARWARCDVVLRGGRQLEQLPTPLLGTGAIPASVQRCAGNGGRRTTVCSRPHTSKVGKVVVGRGKAFPGRAALVRQARCGRGATLVYPGEVQWKAGLRASVCLVPDRRK